MLPAALALKAILVKKEFQEVEKTPHLIETRRFTTNFTDKELLYKTLVEYGANILKETEGEISCEIGNSKMLFEKKVEQYMVEIQLLENEQLLVTDLDCLDREYKKNVQEMVYLNTCHNLKEKGIAIEREEVQEDNSIVLTISYDVQMKK